MTFSDDDFFSIRVPFNDEAFSDTFKDCTLIYNDYVSGDEVFYLVAFAEPKHHICVAFGILSAFHFLDIDCPMYRIKVNFPFDLFCDQICNNFPDVDFDSVPFA